MKHIFVVHSPISLVVAISTISFLRLERRDIVFVFQRKVENLRSVMSLHGSRVAKVPSGIQAEKPARAPWALALVSRFDSVVCSLVGKSPYNLYTFDAVTPSNQLLMTNSFAGESFLMEEGLASMQSSRFLAERDFTPAAGQSLFTPTQSHRFFDSGFMNSRFRHAYKISDIAFPDFPSTNVFNPDVLASLAETSCWDAVIALPGYSLGDFSAKSNDLNRWIGVAKPASIALKGHPAMPEKEINLWTRSVSDAHPSLKIKQPPKMLEPSMHRGSIGLLAGWDSSALHYAKLFNTPTINFAAAPL
jgi:hypothetical protein